MLKTFSTICLLILSASAFSQIDGDTLFYKEALKNSLAVYAKTEFREASLYNGCQYLRPEQSSDDEHPYFKVDDWAIGAVEYDGEIFENVPLLYDLWNDKVITEHYRNASEIELIAEKLSGFTIAEYSFRRIENEAVGNSPPQTGYYQILYDGPSRTIAHWKKNVLRTTSETGVVIDFDEKIKYYILKNGRYFPVKGKASALKLFSDEKKPLKQFIISSKLRFDNNPAAAIARVSEFYDTLKNR
jgi:hypothetical protein